MANEKPKKYEPPKKSDKAEPQEEKQTEQQNPAPPAEESQPVSEPAAPPVETSPLHQEEFEQTPGKLNKSSSLSKKLDLLLCPK